MTPDTSVYAALAGVVAITSAAQLALVAALWSMASTSVASVKRQNARTKEETDAVRNCRLLVVPFLLLAIAGFAINAGSLVGWWYSLADVSSVPGLVIPFWSVVAVTVGGLFVGLASGLRLLGPKESAPLSKTVSPD